jgi:hypothetical protein
VLTLSLLAAATLSAGCAGTGGGGGSSDGDSSGGDGLAKPAAGSIDPGDPVSGEVAVTWKNLNPSSPDVTQTLVNESSEYGQALQSGRVTSTTVRVLSDADMGTLLGMLEEIGFFEHATRNVGLTNIPEVPSRKGIVVVHNNGKDWGLMLSPGAAGTGLPETYRDCKGLVMKVHASVQGLEVQVNVDADRVFSAPPIKMPRR